MAAGDSGLAFDPLSSMGIMMALMSGVSCANTIYRCHTSPTEQEKHLSVYTSGLALFFENFLKTQKNYYKNETRWPEEEFWKRRM